MCLDAFLQPILISVHILRMRPDINGFSHGLKSVHRTLFAPVCGLVPPFRIPRMAKKQIPEWVSAFLVTRRGFVCIFAFGENYGSARSSSRRRRSSAPHLIVRIPAYHAKRGRCKCIFLFLVTRRGFEPRTHCLKGSCSAN